MKRKSGGRDGEYFNGVFISREILTELRDQAKWLAGLGKKDRFEHILYNLKMAETQEKRIARVVKALNLRYEKGLRTFQRKVQAHISGHDAGDEVRVALDGVKFFNCHRAFRDICAEYRKQGIYAAWRGHRDLLNHEGAFHICKPGFLVFRVPDPKRNTLESA